jgi:ribonucleoside-diphosphate reductase beta chain
VAVLAGYEHLLAAADRLQWDAEGIELGDDRRRWASLAPAAQARLTALLAGFWVAEHRVAEHLEPFIEAAFTEIERELLERQAADERRHARFFDRVLREVLGLDPVREASAFASDTINELFERELPAMAGALAAGAVGLERAVGLYHLILEAIALATGQEALLDEATTLPGISEGVARVQADERWHIGLGVHLLSDAGGAFSAELDRLAEFAATAWGPEIATPRRVDRARATHRRRLTVLARDVSD